MTEAKDKLREILREREEGVTYTATNYTVADAVREWLDYGLAGRSVDTTANYRTIAEGHITNPLGAVEGTRAAPVRRRRGILNRAIRRAMARDKAKRDVVILCEVPTGQSGRPSKSLTFDQAEALLAAAERSTMDAYIVVSLLVGARTEELRALRWGEVDLDGRPDAKPPVPPSIAVYRSVRVGGDTKTTKSRRRLALPQRCVASGHRGSWHSFVSLLSANGVRIEDISRLVGHSATGVTEHVYRHQLHVVLDEGASLMDDIFPLDDAG